ncbi:MAG: hypothetical protein P1T08_06600 [Acidimicrobiia bacterium]|nr:hypothetical protein [Acidimicrobiia bacterium]
MKRIIAFLITAALLTPVGAQPAASKVTDPALALTLTPYLTEASHASALEFETVPKEPVHSPVDPEAAALMTWARTRFEAAGLTLPDVTLFVHESRDSCDGNVGLFKGSDAGGEVHLCTEDMNLVKRRTLLHELGHAWTLQHLSGEDISSFLALRGLEHWSEPAPWYHRGIEHAAEIMAWGLYDTELRVVTIEPSDPASLRIAFRFLTGADPICGEN